jgi:hypothetical protein
MSATIVNTTDENFQADVLDAENDFKIIGV